MTTRRYLLGGHWDKVPVVALEHLGDGVVDLLLVEVGDAVGARRRRRPHVAGQHDDILALLLGFVVCGGEQIGAAATVGAAAGRGAGGHSGGARGTVGRVLPVPLVACGAQHVERPWEETERTEEETGAVADSARRAAAPIQPPRAGVLARRPWDFNSAAPDGTTNSQFKIKLNEARVTKFEGFN